MIRVARVVGGSPSSSPASAMLVLPGPGMLTILGGLALIATEFEWAREAIDWVKTRVATVLGEPSEPSN